MKQGPSLASQAFFFPCGEDNRPFNYAHGHARLARETSKVPALACNALIGNSVSRSLPTDGKNTPLLAESLRQKYLRIRQVKRAI